MDLFDYMRETNMKKGESPLASGCVREHWMR